jgi:hypothetical protein
VTYEGDSAIGLLLGLGFAGAGILMLAYDLICLHRNGWDFSKHSGLAWGEEVSYGQRPKNPASMATKIFLIYPIFILIGGFLSFGAIIELIGR